MVINGTKKIDRNDDTEQTEIDDKNIKTSLNSCGVVISNVTAKWKNNQTVNTLDNINLTVKSGSLIAIVGNVGAGKVYIIFFNVARKNKILIKTMILNKHKCFFIELANTSDFKRIANF